ncbi:hypothetical protein AHAS_Ahas11G0138700 [Arachis hypogaea]
MEGPLHEEGSGTEGVSAAMEGSDSRGSIDGGFATESEQRESPPERVTAERGLGVLEGRLPTEPLRA